MPTTPAANPTQKALLDQLTEMAQTDAVNSGNQITYLNDQIAKFENSKTLFQDRYTYWNNFIEPYMLERKYLDGKYQASPLSAITAPSGDWVDFLNKTGRLFNGNLSAPQKYQPVRIAEFDAGALTEDLSFSEAPHWDKEISKRSDLVDGFSTPAFPTGFNTLTTLTTSTTVLRVSRNSTDTFPLNTRFAVYGPSSSAVLTITASNQITMASPFEYDLTVTVHTPSFTAIASGASVVNAVAGFNNTERTTKTAASAFRQSIFNGFLGEYTTAVTDWKANLQLQRDAILTQTTEDVPDTTYVANQLAALNQLIAYLPGMDVSDTGLAAIATLRGTRTSANAARIAWINSRLPASTAPDNRWKYADRLVNLTDGAYATIDIFKKQRDSLVAQQAASNQRAATFAAESF